jgi:hypothetical protein
VPLLSPRFSLPEWAHRTLLLCAPGRPLAPSPQAALAGLSLSPATAQALLHPLVSAAWTAWSEPEAI